MKRQLFGLILTFALGSIASADTPAKELFGAQVAGSMQRSAAFGGYAHGCLAGAQQLPETGPSWQAMRLSRNRNWGHPATIRFIERLSEQAQQIGWNGLYIGDISQPRGGPMTSGHASHQLGLDVDIWMLPPERLNLSANARENISSISIRTEDHRNVNQNWTPQHMAVLRAAASDPAVARIFITGAAKIQMCNDTAPDDRAWLRKIRPWWGHHFHFHVRLNCPRGSGRCENQAAIPAGDGCEEALWWVTDAIVPPPPDPNAPPAPAPEPRSELTLADLPNQCRRVLRSQ
ncbi:MAG: penicillin-insensitive murein endopeptidase [Rhodobacteraceae bacterium]|nr:penicillin-insensitive murein endopeptidase [Paracoccaceae bacterium]